jgi:pimeloyl-ACP methyl ester carboxylesterase
MKIRLFLSLSLFLLLTNIAGAQSRADVDMAVNKFQTLYNNKKYEDVFNMFAPRIQSLLPLPKTQEMMEKLTQQVGEMKAYSFTKQEQQASYYKATFANAALTMVVGLDKDSKLEVFRFLPLQEENSNLSDNSNFIYKSPSGNIKGAIQAPESKKPIPVVLIIAGSGPTDRNGNQATTVNSNAYKMIADSLFNAGIASLCYDKRGVEGSASALKDESKLKFEDMVNDAVGIVKMLKNDNRFSSVYILGHSEGSLVGMLAAAKEPVAGYISVAGIAERADKIIVRQIAAQSEELSLKAAFMLDSLQNGYELKNVDETLAPLFRPSIQPYIASWIKYDPQDEIKKLAIPVLILQGTTDIQVAAEEADKLKAAYPKATLKVIQGMNHALKNAPADRAKNLATYTNPKLPISNGFMPSLIDFVKTNTAKK